MSFQPTIPSTTPAKCTRPTFIPDSVSPSENQINDCQTNEFCNSQNICQTKVPVTSSCANEGSLSCVQFTNKTVNCKVDTCRFDFSGEIGFYCVDYSDCIIGLSCIESSCRLKPSTDSVTKNTPETNKYGFTNPFNSENPNLTIAIILGISALILLFVISTIYFTIKQLVLGNHLRNQSITSDTSDTSSMITNETLPVYKTPEELEELNEREARPIDQDSDTTSVNEDHHVVVVPPYEEEEPVLDELERIGDESGSRRQSPILLIIPENVFRKNDGRKSFDGRSIKSLPPMYDQ